MPKKVRAELRNAALLRKAIKAHTAGASIRQSALIARVSKSKFARDMINTTEQPSKKPHSRRALTDEEEAVICEVLCSQADFGKPCTRNDAADAIQTFVQSMDAERHKRLPFKNMSPGRAFMASFLKRNKAKLHLGRPQKEAEERWRACNGETLTTHIATFEKLLEDNGIADSHVYNLDETGVTPNKDTAKRTNCKHILRSGMAQSSQIRTASFRNVDRVTMLGTICADGTTVPPLFVVKGKSIPYRMIENLDTNRHEMESMFDCLPEGSMVAVREDTASVDRHNFADWAARFVELVKPKTEGGRKVVLTYDGYRSHVSLLAIQTLRDGNVLPYCLPAHTSGKTQPLDVGIYGLFKRALNVEVQKATQLYSIPEFDQFDLFHMLHRAYMSTFTICNIRSAFRKAGVYPVNGDLLLGSARPVSAQQADTVLNAEALLTLLEEKRDRIRKGECLQSVVLRRGYLDTSQGLLMSRPDCVKAIETKETEERLKFASKAAQDARDRVKIERERAVKRAERARFERWALDRRVRAYKDPDVLPRPFKVRAAIAKESKRARSVDDAREVRGSESHAK